MKSFARRSRTWLLCAAAALVGRPRLRAASPRDELLRFVPDDVGFCFVMQDLRVHAADLADSPFVEQLRQSPLGAALQASKELSQLDQIDRGLQQSFGAGFDQLRDDLLGDAVVFAYRPGPPDKPDQEQGLILVRRRTAPSPRPPWSRTINKAQKKDGTLTDLQECSYKGVTYFRRVEPRQTNYYAIRGPVLLFTSQEEMLQRAIDVDQNGGGRRAAAGPASAGGRGGSGGPGVVGEPAGVRRQSGGQGGQGRRGRRGAAKEGAGLLEGDGRRGRLGDAGHGISPVAGGAGAARRPSAGGPAVVGGGVAAERGCGATSPTTPFWRAAAASTPAPSWRCCRTFSRRTTRAPPRTSSSARTSSRTCCPTSARTGVCASPLPPADGKDWLPQALLAVRVARGDDAAPVDEALLSAVHTAALLGVLGYNHDHPTAAAAAQVGGI